ncbi:DNA-binding transcriptional regulator, MarR family [Nakamurella panacisegetis]|uniref:DNA-binding transcriptional regulator, MarR family n=1 Tax=Nakamurella panacisegetis TaxID=1090615 RepID=A0A1H0SPT6_9ACTN|nr:MarR family transcriptional regulator [Nakamurella panacisegetis]SDP43665.1 DNA-binding transcriptional regulator, MarR family [Nakamurella panacisegetis]
MSLEQERSDLWVRMYEVVTDHLAGRRAAVAEQLGISFIKAKALRRLLPHPLGMGELTAELNTDPPYTTLLVDDLVDRDLVARATDPSDRRRKLVALTPRGAELARAAQRILAEPPAGFDRLEPEDLHRLVAMFNQMSVGHFGRS